MMPPPTDPRCWRADAGTRTPDPFITSEVLYQLSYVGACLDAIAVAHSAGALAFCCCPGCYRDSMKQLTLRVDDRLADFLKQAAATRSESVNAYAHAVLSAAVDPELAGDEAAQMRERLSRAGLLAVVPCASHPAPAGAALARARKRAGRGQSLSSLVAEDRS
jgi:hypothetical protein